jgi:peptidase M1-like protein
MHAVVAFVLACSASVQTPYDTVFDQIRNLAPLPNAAAPVHGVVLRRDVLELKLDDGVAYQLTPVAGRTTAIAWVGSGSISFVPPLQVEQFNLKRVLGDSTINGAISSVVLFFADSTEAELGRSLKFGPAPQGAADPSGAIGAALDYIVDGRSRSADGSLVTALLNHTTTGFFAAYIQRKRGESVMIQVDPMEAEEVILYRRGKMVGQRTETVCQFERAADLISGVSAADERPEPLAVTGYDIDATIEGSYKFSARTTIKLAGRSEQPQQWVPFYLFNELNIDSVVTDAGRPLTFFRKDHFGGLWVHLAEPLATGKTQTIRVVYHGNLIGFGSALPEMWDDSRGDYRTVLDAWAFIKDTETWYPRYRGDEVFDVTLTFHTPKSLRFSTIGRLVQTDTQSNTIVTKWVSELPTNQVSFNIGSFDEVQITDQRIPPVTIQLNTEAHGLIRRFIPTSRGAPDDVGSDVANSLSFFTSAFGPPLFHHYYATEIPYWHGQAFPGMIHLSFVTFLGLQDAGHDESFRAHEMAHQWWGIGVEPASYRDAWLSEGFAEFAGMWYMQTILRDNDKYFKMLRESRDEIRRTRDKAVPIGLGYRALENWRGNYSLVTYQKGAWVLHMLRNMMIDPRTMSEDRFKLMMRNFYETYRGKRATTLDFQRIVEKHVGRPMDWFFDEWVYGTSVPTYTFAWNVEPADGGKFAAHLRIKQTDVPATFAMYVPLRIKFEQGEALIRVLVKGPLTEQTITLPAEAKSMELSPFESVLAVVKTEGW